MDHYKSEFISQCEARGFIHQGTDLQALDKLMASGSIVAYLGFDPTATSLHVGNLVQIMLLRLLQKTGHKPIVLVGGATARAGDPSGRDEVRSLLSIEQIDANIDGVLKNLKKYIRFDDSPTGAILVNNADWLLDLNYLDFLRDYGRYFSVNRMLTFDSVRLRLDREQPLSFLEFNYMILQAYDFLELNRRYSCILQMGGSDQWGNIVNGVDLVKRLQSKEGYGLTTPLIMTADGKKMGKSLKGAIWLSEEQLSSFDFWQFWRNTSDADVRRFLKLYTELSLDEIESLCRVQGEALNEAKIILANEVTRLCHGDEAVEEAGKTAAQLFSKNIASMSPDELKASLPVIQIKKEELEKGMSILDALKVTGLALSSSEARRLIHGRGARLNDVVVEDEMKTITLQDIQTGNIVKLSSGKKKHALLCLENAF